MAIPLAPFLIWGVRIAATKLLQRAALKAAVPTLASRALVASHRISNSPGATTPLLQRVPAVGNIVRQPKLVGLKPIAAPAATRTGRAAQRVNPRRATSPLWTQKMPLKTPVQVPGSTARVTARSMGVPERLARTVASPVRLVAQSTSPRSLGGFAEVSAYSTGIGALTRNREAQAQMPGGATVRPTNAPIVDEGTSSTPATPPVVTTPPVAPPAGGGTPPVIPAPAPGAPGPTEVGPVDDVLAQDEANRQELEQNLAAIGASYNNTVNEIKRLYNLSETEEEKELLRLQLADLEAQVKAGQEAVQTLYGEKTSNLQLMASRSRKQGTQAAEGVGALYSGAATDLQALQEARRAAQTEQYRGLGIGATSLDTEYADLLSTLAPIAQASTQTIADIGAQGLDYLSGLSESMGAARVGELQSLGVSRDAAIRQTYIEDVLDRIADDRRQMNQQVGSVLASQASAISSAIQSFRDEGGDPTYADMWYELLKMSQNNVSPETMPAQFQQFFPGAVLSPELQAQYKTWYDAFKLGQDLELRESTADMSASESLALQERIYALIAQGYGKGAIEKELGIKLGEDFED